MEVPFQTLYLCCMHKRITIHNNNIRIPALLWGKPDNQIIISVHGDLSNKEDTIIKLLAKNAIPKDYQVLSFDLPGHGERKDDEYECNPQNCISDLRAVYAYARSLSADITLFACSIGAYFSLLAYYRSAIRKSLFLSPVINMELVIQNMMDGFQIDEQRLREERKIPLPIGKTLDWEYYIYVRQHPVHFNPNSSISILYGSKDTLTPMEEINHFTEKYHAKLTVMENAEHYFHSDEQLVSFETWLNDNLES